jgi:chromatin-remodeling ATPase INO80
LIAHGWYKMSGGAPFTAQSPSQSHYSPTNLSRPSFYSHEQYPPPQRTPPPFPPPTLTHSPHYSRPPALGSPLAASHANIASHSGSAQPYQPPTSSPPYQLQRSFSGQLVPSTIPASYEHTPPSHAHPSSRQGSMIHSPVREHHAQMVPTVNGGGHDIATFDSRPKSQEVGQMLIS